MSTPARVPVELGPRRYEVLVGCDLLADLGVHLRSAGLRQTQAFVLTNPEVGAHHFPATAAALERAGFTRVVRHDIPAQEDGKSWNELSRTCAALLTHFPDAGSVPLVLLLGGGVVGDLGGFAAGIFRRGVPFVQVPTSLLAAVDSSVGGKVAVNFGGVKNILGVFNQPQLVVCDLALLRTLDPRQIRSGASEIIKYGAVCSAPLFEQLERGALEALLRLEPTALTDIVQQCVALKARVVERDELDKKGIRNVLNFGHTIGHALELSASHKEHAAIDPLGAAQAAPSHGEAIAIGMVAATGLARGMGLVDETFDRRLRALLQRAGLPLTFSEFRRSQPAPHADYPDLFDRVKRALLLDKKFRDGRNVFVLPTGVGRWEQRENLDWPLVDDAIRAAL